MMSESQPGIQPGASLLVAWQVAGKDVLIIGGGEVASQRLLAVLNADARVTLVAPSPLHPNIVSLLPFITYKDRTFRPSDLDSNPNIVLTAISDAQESRVISAICRERRIPINVADDPPACDFYFGSIVRRGPLQILISTNGNGPKIASLMKKRIEDALPEDIAQVIENVGNLRKKLRQRTKNDTDVQVGPRRMRWISRVCDVWSFQDLASMNEQNMTRLLDEGWEKDVVPSPTDIIQHDPESRPSYSKFTLLRTLPALEPGFSFMIGLLSGTLVTATLRYIFSKRSL